MRLHLARFVASAVLVTTAAACTSATPATGPTPQPLVQTTLRVALFPYLPDVANDTLQAMQESIERLFEAANPQVDLQLRRMDPNDNDFYVPDSLQMWLGSQAGDSGYHVVEVDAIMLGDLAAAGVLQPWQTLGDSANWMAGVLPALTYDGTLYGIPHWLCGDFILTAFPAVNQATTVGDFVAALDTASANEVKLSGALSGSWTLPALYLHTWADTYGPQGMAGAIDTLNLDSAVVRQMRSVLEFCELGSVNTCLDGDVFTPDSSVAIYASGRSDAFLGFSERLTAIMMKGWVGDPEFIRLSPAPLGPGRPGGNLPVLYVDALVLGHDCDDACQQAATAFATYLLNDTTYQWMLTSMDAQPDARIPRYLLPATRSAFQVQGVATDPHFQQMQAAVQGAVPLPNTGFAANRKGMQRALLRVLGASTP